MVNYAAHVIRFADPRTAYSFVADLRRLYDLDRFVGLRVHRTPQEVLVEIPDAPAERELVDLAERHGGHLAAGPEEMKRLRLAIDTARDAARQSRDAISRARQAMDDAAMAIDRANSTSRRAPLRAKDSGEERHRR